MSMIQQFAIQEVTMQEVLNKAVSIWGQGTVANRIGVERETVNRWYKKQQFDQIGHNHENYSEALQSLLPQKPRNYHRRQFNFIDLFAGIGGIRKGFEEVGGKCIFTSEWNPFAQRTYMANHYDEHPINGDIKEITEALGNAEDDFPDELAHHIDQQIPDHHLLLAGFPCQPFSIAGVSKKNALGRAHGFDCKIQGTLFFDICKILKVKRPACFMLENVKNLKSHNKGDTYQTIIQELEKLGYTVPTPRIIDAAKFVPQHRERIVITGYRKDLSLDHPSGLESVRPRESEVVSRFGDLLETDAEAISKYTLTPKLWEYLKNYKKKHRSSGNGFGYDIFLPESPYTRTLSARYYKDGSEVLIAKDHAHKKQCENGDGIPRRLTPRECARLMGFDAPGESNFNIPVSDTQAYKQFGNSVVVPVFRAVARLMKQPIMQAVALENV